jgi:excinuclease ABC subunit B
MRAVLVTTLTKRMAEDLTDYLQQAGCGVRYLHSDIDAIERMEILRGLRLGDVRRAGRDQPAARRASICRGVAGRHSRSPIRRVSPLGPLAGADDRRRPRNVNGRAILYADRITGSMRRALDEMDRRRACS